MAKPDKEKKDHVLNQIANCQKQIDHLNEVIADPRLDRRGNKRGHGSLQDQVAKMERLTGGRPVAPA